MSPPPNSPEAMKPTEPMSFFSNECAAHLELTRCSTSATSLPSVGKIAPIYSPQKKRTASQRTIPFVARGLEREEDEVEDVIMVESWGARVIDALLAATALIEPFLRDPMKYGCRMPYYSCIVKEPMWMERVVERYAENRATCGAGADDALWADVHLMLQNCSDYCGTVNRSSRHLPLVCEELRGLVNRLVGRDVIPALRAPPRVEDDPRLMDEIQRYREREVEIRSVLRKSRASALSQQIRPLAYSKYAQRLLFQCAKPTSPPGVTRLAEKAKIRAMGASSPAPSPSSPLPPQKNRAARFEELSRRYAELGLHTVYPLRVSMRRAAKLNARYQRSTTVSQIRSERRAASIATQIAPASRPAAPNTVDWYRQQRARAAQAPIAYDTGVVEKMARDFCEDLIEKSTKLRERLLRDTLAGKSVAHAHLEETNELHLACTGFLDQLDADSCYFFRDTDAKMWGS